MRSTPMVSSCAGFGRVARDRAAADDGTFEVYAVDPAAVLIGRVRRDRAVADGGVGVVAEDPAAVAARVGRDRAAADGGGADVDGAVGAGDPAAGVARNVAIVDGGTASRNGNPGPEGAREREDLQTTEGGTAT